MARDIRKVLSQIMSYVPYDFERRDEMDRRFQAVIDSAAYTLPDYMGERWHEAQVVLLDCLGTKAMSSKLGWVQTIIRIWTKTE
jgi:hypothetical protein